MSNVTQPFGLRPVRYMDGTPWNGATVKMWVDDGYATALYVGDAVTYSATAADKLASAKYPTVIQASAGTTNIIKGVIVSFDPDPTNLERTYRAASTSRFANVVIPTPYLVFQVRDDGGGTPAATFPMGNANFEVGTGSTVTGLSGFALDFSAAAPTTTQAHQAHILGLSDLEDNELGDYAIWDVIINTCQNATGIFLGVTGA